MDGIANLQAATTDARLVIFVGAGVSMGSPTNLPSWRDVNRIIVNALASNAIPVVSEAAARQVAELILTRHENEKLPPEYQAEVLAGFLHHRYFEVLRHIDSNRPNATHLAIAWLARLGYVRTVITTNFDRVLEAAFAALRVPLEQIFLPEQFEALAAHIGKEQPPDGFCRLLKLHGSTDDPATLIDTLAQRKRGFPPAVIACVRQLLHSGHWLFLGFSGLDLEAEPNYLALSEEAEAAAGFTWVVREHTEPRPAVVRLQARYGERGALVYGDLPDWLLEFTSTLSAEPRAWIEKHHQLDAVSPCSDSPISALENGAQAWAAKLTPAVCAMSLAFVAIACSEPQLAARFMEGILSDLDDREGLVEMKSLCANALGNALAGLGRYEEALQHIRRAVKLAQDCGDADTHDRWLGNLAYCLETLGRIEEARSAYESVLEGHRSRGDPAMIAYALTSLASHLIRQMHLDQAKAHAEEAIGFPRQAGDERARGTALHDIGLIDKIRGDYPEALRIFAEVEALFARLGDDCAAAAATSNRGEIFATLGRFEEAERIQESVLAVVERLDRLDNQGATYLSLGLLEQQRGDLAAAERWITRALELFRRIKDPSNEAFALYRLAALAVQRDDFAAAIELAQAALPLVSGKNAAFTVNLWSEIGRANLKLGFVSRAERAYRECITLQKELGLAKPLASATMNLGTTLLLQQRDDEAVAAFDEAAETFRLLDDQQNLAYCRLCKAAVCLDSEVAALSDAGHATTNAQLARAKAQEMIALYPDLIGMYREIGAMDLVAEFCCSAASTACFAGEFAHAVDWYRQAGQEFQDLGLMPKAAESVAHAESLLQQWANTLLRTQEMAAAVPVLLQLAEVSAQLGHSERRATALYKAAIGLASGGQHEAAGRLAAQAADLYEPGSDDAGHAAKLVARCHENERPT
jgi:tetratricopeptide (TPR) repeat protein